MELPMVETTRDTAAADAHPSGDERFRMVDTALKRHRHRPDALIEVLHTAQEVFGHLDHDLLFYVAHGLNLAPGRVYGVASFYHLFRFQPKGAHQCTVCLGTACFVKGGANLLAAAEQTTGIHPGQVLPGGALSLDTARCVGACGLAPVVIFDGKVCGNQTAETVAGRVKGWLSHGTA
jgi:bidirectional [NiFe] hydrogenase diaphorase subunit